MKRTTLEAINRAIAARQPLVRVVDLATGDERLVAPGAEKSPLGDAVDAAARADRSTPLEIDGKNLFLCVHNPPLDLVIIGAVHIAQALAPMAALAGYGVRIVDARTAFATPERFPGTALSHDWPDEALDKAPLGPRSALVALSHDPKFDDPALAQALRSDAFYVGALGSKKSHAARLARLKAQGFSDAELARIRGPVGLDIAARTPAEIAISILAEMTLQLRAGSGWERPATRATA
jgi:xanthine dehydrogenase accessory factor